MTAAPFLSIERLATDATIARLNLDLDKCFDPAGLDAKRVHVINDCVIGFHVTTPERAERILIEGPQDHITRVGHKRREMPAAFWLNCVPWIPYSIEQTHPAFHQSDMAVLACLLDTEVSRQRLVFEPTWCWVQWAAKAHEVKNIVPVGPEMFWKFRSQEAATTLKGYLESELPVSDGYAAKLLAILQEARP